MKLAPIAAVAALALAACTPGDPGPAVTPTPFAVSDAAAWQAAIDTNDVNAVNALIEADGSPTPLLDGTVAISAAAAAGSADVVDALIAAGSPVDITDDAKWTPLHFAAESNCVPCVESLLAAGADALAKDRAFPSRAPIHVAAAAGSTEAVAALIQGGTPVDTTDGAGGHALLWAAYKGKTDTALYLLEQGADPTLVDGSRNNASQRAAGQGFDDLAEILADAIEAWEASH